MQQEKTLQEALLKFSRLAAECSYELSSELGILDLKIRYTNCLKVIGGTENLTFGMLAKFLNITKPSVTDTVNQLIKMGYVQKQQSPEDKRIFYIELTEKGKKLAEYEQLRNKKIAKVIKSALSDDEVDGFIALLDKVDKKGERQ